jgi:hypothetical protein
MLGMTVELEGFVVDIGWLRRHEAALAAKAERAGSFAASRTCTILN